MVSKDLAAAVAALVIQQSSALSSSLGLKGFEYWKGKAEITAVFVDEKELPSPAQALGPVLWRSHEGVTGVEVRLDLKRLETLAALPKERQAVSFLPEAAAQMELARAKNELLPLRLPNYVYFEGLERARPLYEAAAARALWTSKDALAPTAGDAAAFSRWEEILREPAKAQPRPWSRLRVSSGEDGTLRVEGKPGGTLWLQATIKESAEMLAEQRGAAAALRDAARRERAAALALLAKPLDEAQSRRWLGQSRLAQAHTASARGDWREALAGFEGAAAYFAEAGGGPDVAAERGPAASQYLRAQRDAVKAGRLREALDNLRGFHFESGADEELTTELAGLLLDAAAEEGPKAGTRAAETVASFGPKPGVIAVLRARAGKIGGATGAAAVLGRLGKPGWEELRRMLEDRKATSEAREAALGGLYPGLLAKDEQAVSALEKAAREDKSHDLRLLAYRALRSAGLLKWELIEASMKSGGGVMQRAEAVSDARDRFDEDPKRAEAVLRQGLSDKAARVADDAREALRSRGLPVPRR
jgi:hypothetical protein